MADTRSQTTKIADVSHFSLSPLEREPLGNSSVLIATSAARRTQRVPWLCVAPFREVCLFGCYGEGRPRDLGKSRETSYGLRYQPGCNLHATSPRRRPGSGHLAALSDRDLVRRLKDGVRADQVSDTFVAEPTELMSGMQSFAVRTPNDANKAGPSATVADTLTLPSKLLDAIRSVCHPCHPLSGAIGNTLVGGQLNRVDRVHGLRPGGRPDLIRTLEGTNGPSRALKIPVRRPGVDLQ